MENQNNIILRKLNAIEEKIDNKQEDIWMTLKQVCSYVQLSESSIRRSCASGNLKFSRSSAKGRLLFKKSDVERFLSNG